MGKGGAHDQRGTHDVDFKTLTPLFARRICDVRERGCTCGVDEVGEPAQCVDCLRNGALARFGVANIERDCGAPFAQTFDFRLKECNSPGPKGNLPAFRGNQACGRQPDPGRRTYDEDLSAGESSHLYALPNAPALFSCAILSASYPRTSFMTSSVCWPTVGAMLGTGSSSSLNLIGSGIMSAPCSLAG